MNDGGSAFPRHINHLIGNTIKEELVDGMSLRDWFAGMALQGIRATAGGSNYSKEMAATLAYADADAMLKEREEPTR